ncbi:MAG: M36 family metallopeptidase [Nevskiaceae bacterium]
MKRFLTGAVAALLAFGTGSAVGVTPPGFQLKAKQAQARQAQSQQGRANQPRHKADPDARFRWAEARGPALPLSPLSLLTRPETAARSALREGAGKLDMTAAAAEAAELRELHDLGHGPVIARYQQKHDGLDVFGAQVSVVMDRNYRPVAYSGRFAKTPRPTKTLSQALVQATTNEFALEPGAAAQAALRDLSRASKAPGLNLLQAPTKFEKMYYAGTGEMIPAYRFVIGAGQVDGARPYTYGYLVSAVDGTILVRKNMLDEVAFTYRAYADNTTPYKPFDGPLGNVRTPFMGANPDDNGVRTPVASSLVTTQNGPISTNDAWLGSAASNTQGQTVRAYADLNAPDGIAGDSYTPTTSSLTFNYASTADANPAPATARHAGVVNMFFTMSWLHDFWYDHGFNEAAGNAQLLNQNRGGEEGDPILAESQDYAGFNNANMATLPDGQSPRMQMYLWDGFPGTLEVTTPALGQLDAASAQFGAKNYNLSDDVAEASVADGCTAFAGVTGQIALIDRGNCNFIVKVKNAQNAGAVGAIVANNVPLDGPAGMAGADATITIPALGISFEDGQALHNQLPANPVAATMLRVAGDDRDAALDNGVIAHEFFHYVSNRLVNDAFGLINLQGGGMGEGWSDFNSMMIFVRPEDQALAGNATWGGIYSTGVYVDSSAYYGIRRAPYSTDFAVNPLTFQHIQEGVPLPNTAPLQFGGSGTGNSEEHSTGEIWANMLWEVYAALLNKPGTTFATAQGRMQDYVIAGLKTLGLSPTFIEARDGILAAARATDQDDFELIAEAFAKRGIGAGAVGPDRDSLDNVGVTESYVAFAGAYGIEDFNIDLAYFDGTNGYCDLDQALDPGETALMTFTVVSNGTLDLAAGATIQVSTDGDVTLDNGGLVTLPALDVGETFDVQMPITLNSAGSTAEPLTITLAFPQAGGAPDEVFEPATINEVRNVNLDLGPTETDDDMEVAEASQTDWSVALSNPASGPPWVIEDFDADYGTGQVWYAHDNGTTASSTLTTPQFHVNTTFTLTFDHFFELEEPAIYDAAVLEISIDGGPFVDVTTAGGTFGALQGYNGTSVSAFPTDRVAWVGTNSAMTPTGVSFGNALAGHNARIRFRLETDEAVGAYGWVVDNVHLIGISAPVFSGVVAENGACLNHVPHVDAGPAQSVNEGALVTMAGTASDDENEPLTIAWTRVSGPTVTLTGANTLAPTFTAPNVTAFTTLTLQMAVTDGTTNVTDTVVVSINNVSGGGGGGGGGGALGSELALLGLFALLRRRKQPSA